MLHIVNILVSALSEPTTHAFTIQYCVAYLHKVCKEIEV